MRLDIFVNRLIAPDLYRSTVSDVQRNKGARDRISDTGQSALVYASESHGSLFYVDGCLLLRLALQCNSCADLCPTVLHKFKIRKVFFIVFLLSTRDGKYKRSKKT